jgi:ABC-type glycerol-3-phosphate transport system permease component
MTATPTIPVSAGSEGRRSTGVPPWVTRPRLPVRILKAAVIGYIVVVMIYPILYVVMSAFSVDGGAISAGLIPTKFSLSAFRTIFGGQIVVRALLISIGVTVVGATLSLIVTIGMAYGLSRSREVPGTRLMLWIVIGAMLFPTSIIPNFLLVKQLGLLNSWWSIILPVLCSAFNLVVMRNFFMELPRELFESARIDGASEWLILIRIVLPLSRAVIAVIGLFYAVGYWNDYFAPLLYLNDSDKWPIQLVLNQYVLQGQSLGQIGPPGGQWVFIAPESIQAAIVLIATVPILIVYPFIQRFFTKGMLTGAIKG